MLAERLRLHSFRSYADAELALGAGVTVVTGPNGAGKTNLLEALYFACTARSCRTANEREVVGFGSKVARVELDVSAPHGLQRLAVGFAPGEAKRLSVDGSPVERFEPSQRPLVSVFLPDRLELVKGAPAVRRAHLDHFVAALWPARAGTQSAFRASLAQRNALLARIRAGTAGRAALAAWDGEFSRHAVALMADRREAAGLLQAPLVRLAAAIGLDGEVEAAYRPRSHAGTPGEFSAELRERHDSDIERGFGEHGPQRDDLVLRRDGRGLRAYGSQGQQRLGVLALLLAERDVLAEQRGQPPLMLLDDVMSELDADRRRALVDLLRSGGQSLITATELAHVPGAEGSDVQRVAVSSGRLLAAAGREAA